MGKRKGKASGMHPPRWKRRRLGEEEEEEEEEEGIIHEKTRK